MEILKPYRIKRLIFIRFNGAIIKLFIIYMYPLLQRKNEQKDKSYGGCKIPMVGLPG